MIDLGAIEARANAATQGPWRDGDFESGCVVGNWPEGHSGLRGLGGIVVLRRTNGASLPRDPDLDFIKAARTDIPALLAHVRALEAAIRLTLGSRSELTADAADALRLALNSEGAK